MKITIEYSTAQLEKCGDEAVLSTFLDRLQSGDIDLSKPATLRLVDTDEHENDVRWGTMTVAEEDTPCQMCNGLGHGGPDPDCVECGDTGRV